MKTKLFTSVFAFFIFIAVTHSQTSEHLTFKGVPIDGTLNNYITKMKQSEFTHVGTEDGIAMLSGDFAGYKDCIVGVSTLKGKDLVHKIIVLFHERETWSSLSGNYFDLKEMLIEKYGEPDEVVEKFDDSYSERDDNSKMFNVKIDNCKYYSTFRTSKGDIELSIEHDGVTRCFVRLAYLDKINGQIIKSKAKGDL